jgi:hypothetical protein
MALERSQRELQHFFRPHSNRRSKQEVMDAQSPESANRDNFGTPLWESREKAPFGYSLGRELQKILYGGRWWLPPSLGRGESNECKLPMACPNTKGVSECELTHLWLVLDAESCNKIIIPLPSLIPRLLTRPSHPLYCWKLGAAPKFNSFRISSYLDLQVGLTKGLGVGGQG